MTKDKRVTVRLDDETYDYIKLLSEQRGKPMAFIVRKLLQRYLNKTY